MKALKSAAIAPPLKNISAAEIFESTLPSGALPRIASRTKAAAPLSRTREQSARLANRLRSRSMKTRSRRGSGWLAASSGMVPIIIPVWAAL